MELRIAPVILALGLSACGAVFEPAAGVGAGDRPGGGGGAGEVRGYAARCAGCHGPTGAGTDFAPQIRSPHEGYAAWVIRNGRRTAGSLGYPADMPAFGDSIDEAELEEILSFLQEQPMPEDGEGLYLRFCGNCHGPDGRGGVVGESAREEAEDREDFFEIVREGEGGTSYGDRDDFMPARGRSELTDDELEKIRRFLLGAR